MSMWKRDAARVASVAGPVGRARSEYRSGRLPAEAAWSGHSVQQRLARCQPSAILRCQAEAALERAGRQPGDVWGQDDVWQVQQSIGRVDRFMDEHVEA